MKKHFFSNKPAGFLKEKLDQLSIEQKQMVEEAFERFDADGRLVYLTDETPLGSAYRCEMPFVLGKVIYFQGMQYVLLYAV